MKTLQENLKLFYLGTIKDEPYFYKNKDLTTHALIIGMTGSGKTGLGVSLLEEACIDNIPSIIIDPKGDLSNLALSFSKKEEFLPFIDESENQSKDEIAQNLQENLQKGLEESFQDLSRVELLRQSANVKIYTPKSNAGIGINLLGDFSAPENLDFEELNNHTLCLTNSILTLANISCNENTCPEILLIQGIFNHNFLENKSLNIAELINQIANPPFEKIGVFDINSFYPAQKRMSLAMKINALVASASFSGWCSGESLNISKMLFDENGKANANIFSISHLNDNERMFFVSVLLNAMLNWMRSQNGTNSLRAILYMDEIYGFFPPNGNPPSKMPMMTLLKQARAFGLGCVLATQNPVDIDYKGLSNIGTWFIGHLQTPQDKQRVIDGLSSNSNLNKKELGDLISNMPKRQFLIKNINDNDLVVIKTRFALSYLKGPLNKDEISRLMQVYKGNNKNTSHTLKANTKPMLSPLITQAYCINSANEFKAYLYGSAKVRYNDNKGIDYCKEVYYLLDLDGAKSIDWQKATENKLNLNDKEPQNASYCELTSIIAGAKDLKEQKRILKDFIYTNAKLSLFSALNINSKPEESKAEFYLRLQDKANEILEEKTEIFIQKFQAQKARLQAKLKIAEQRVQKETSDLKNAGLNTAFSIGGAILGLFSGNKTITNRAISSAKTANRALNEKNQLQNAKQARDEIENELNVLILKFEDEMQALKSQYDIKNITLQSKEISPKKSDIFDENVILVWKN